MSKVIKPLHSYDKENVPNLKASHFDPMCPSKKKCPKCNEKLYFYLEKYLKNNKKQNKNK